MNSTCQTCLLFLILFFKFLFLSLLTSLFYFLHSKGDIQQRAMMWVMGDQELITEHVP